MWSYEDYLKMDKGCLYIIAIIILVLLLFLIGSIVLSQDTSEPFWRCINKVGLEPINIIWDSGNYIESMRDPDMISSILNLNGEAIEWDSSVGAHMPDNIQSMRNANTIALTLSDGTLVSFIINQFQGDRYYGWMTYSTYRTTANYNPDPNPHVLCGFWSILDDDYYMLRELFLSKLTQNKPFENWMR
jgi:hypothetical protein